VAANYDPTATGKITMTAILGGYAWSAAVPLRIALVNEDA
jgi:hypothetical protein